MEGWKPASPPYRLYKVNFFHLVKRSPLSLQLFTIHHAACCLPEPETRPVGLLRGEAFLYDREECRVSSINTGAANKSGHFQGHGEKNQTPHGRMTNAALKEASARSRSTDCKYTTRDSERGSAHIVRKVNEPHSFLNR